jgi:hypothetical protein
LEKHRLLHAESQDGGIQISGTFATNDNNGEIDRYQVRIVLRHDYPSSMPDVWEIGGRIPRTADRHVYPSTGQSCVMIPDQRWELWPAGSTLMQFVDGPVRSYFIGQSLVEQGEKWPSGEWEHGIFGVADYYAELLRSPSLDATLKLLAAIGEPAIRGHIDCPCHSGKRMWHCHQERIRDVRKRMGSRQALDARQRLIAGYEQHAATVISMYPRAASLLTRHEVFELARACIKAALGGRPS